MTDGSLGKVNFDGALDCEVDFSYGLGSYKLSAPDVGLVQQSLSKAWQKLTPPSLDMTAGRESVGGLQTRRSFRAADLEDRYRCGHGLSGEICQ